MTTIHLTSPLSLGALRLPNRLYRAPALEGAGKSQDPAAVYARHFVENAASGTALIIQGNTIVTPEGRTSPGMSAIDGQEAMAKLASMTAAVHQAGGAIVCQIGHGGIFAIEGWHKDHVTRRRGLPWAPSPLPLWLKLWHGGVHVLSTQEVEALVQRFGLVAAWAREAGYDGVQLAASNAKLLHQFLSPTYNRRTDRYGGGVEARAQLLGEIREAIAAHAGPDFPVLLKYAALEVGVPFGALTLDEGIATARLAESMGFCALTPVIADVVPNTAICRGSFPEGTFGDAALDRKLRAAVGSPAVYWATRLGMYLAARRYPFAPIWNRAVFAAVKRAVSIPVFAVGGIRTPAEAAEILRAGDADMIGLARPFYAEPDLARRFLADPASRQPTLCESCNRCVVPQMLGLPGVCYRPDVHKQRHRAA